LPRLIEARAVDRARNAIKGLLDMAPEKRSAAGRRQLVAAGAAAVALDAVRACAAGCAVPMDGV
jgi:Cd2+/Zn2+-exporting ATPase